MTRVESIHPHPAESPADAIDPTHHSLHTGPLRDAVTRAIRTYLDELDGQVSTDVYQMVLAQIEAPLLEEIMAYTRNNQTRASLMLGLNRGTLRKKLKQYNLISEKD
jgi:Fis family transcriptional regulator